MPEEKHAAYKGQHHDHHDHERAPMLDHEYDSQHTRYEEEDRLRHDRTTFSEVHHPHEDVDFGSHHDRLRHEFPHDTDYHHPREASEHTFHDYRHYSYENKLPMTPANDPKDNVLDDEDPAICFVKAYARKPMGEPSKQSANSIHRDYYYDD